MKRSILVTGGAGYIGSITVRQLLDQGYRVSVIDSLIRGHREAVDSRAQFLKADIDDSKQIKEFLKTHRPEVVIHCAALIDVAESVRDPELYMKNNFEKASRFFWTCLDERISKFVLSSTAAVYGEPKTEIIAEDHPTKPINPYGDSKRQLEFFLEGLCKREGAQVIVFRYFNVAGATEDAQLGEAHDPETHLIPLIVRAFEKKQSISIFGTDYPTRDGTCVRDYVHVEDLADAHRVAIEHLKESSGFQVFNLGSKSGFTVKEVITEAEKIFNERVIIEVKPRREGDPACLLASSDRARSILGWKAERSEMSRMIRDALKWHRHQRF